MTETATKTDRQAASAELARLEEQQRVLPARHGEAVGRGDFEEARRLKAAMAEIADRRRFAEVQLAQATLAAIAANLSFGDLTLWRCGRRSCSRWAVIDMAIGSPLQSERTLHGSRIDVGRVGFGRVRLGHDDLIAQHASRCRRGLMVPDAFAEKDVAAAPAYPLLRLLRHAHRLAVTEEAMIAAMTSQSAQA